MTAFYYFYCKDTQKFSEEEQKAMFAIYVINANLLKSQKKKNGLRKKNNDENSITFFSKFSSSAIDILNFLSNPFQERISFNDELKHNNDFLSDSNNTNTNTNKNNTLTNGNYADKSIQDNDLEKNYTTEPINDDFNLPKDGATPIQDISVESKENNDTWTKKIPLFSSSEAPIHP